MTAAREPTWTTTSFFPKTTPLRHRGHHRLNKMTPARCVTTIANRATTHKTRVAIPIKIKKVVRLPKVEANRASQTTGSFVVVAVVVADAATTET